MWNHKNTWIAKTILGKKSSAGVSSSYWDVLSGHCNKNKRHADHQNKTEDQNMSSHNVSHLLFDKDNKHIHRRKWTMVTKRFWKNWIPYEKSEDRPISVTSHKNHLQKYKRPKCETWNTKTARQKNINSTLYNIGVRKDLLNRTLFA